MVNKDFFYIGTSKFQGYLRILFDLVTKKVIVYDDAFSVQWDDIIDALKDNKDIKVIGEGYLFAKELSANECRSATWDEIIAAGWEKYIINKPELSFPRKINIYIKSKPYLSVNVTDDAGINLYPTVCNYLSANWDIERLNSLIQKIVNYTFDYSEDQNNIPEISLINDQYLQGIQYNPSLLQYLDERLDTEVEIIPKAELLQILFEIKRHILNGSTKN